MRLLVIAVILVLPAISHAQAIARDECAPYGETRLAGYPAATVERTLRSHHLERVTLRELARGPDGPAGGSDTVATAHRDGHDVAVVVMSEVGCLALDDVFAIDADHVVHRIAGPTHIYWNTGTQWTCHTPKGDQRCAVGRTSKVRLFVLPDGARYGGVIEPQ